MWFVVVMLLLIRAGWLTTLVGFPCLDSLAQEGKMVSTTVLTLVQFSTLIFTMASVETSMAKIADTCHASHLVVRQLTGWKCVVPRTAEGARVTDWTGVWTAGFSSVRVSRVIRRLVPGTTWTATGVLCVVLFDTLDFSADVL